MTMHRAGRLAGALLLTLTLPLPLAAQEAHQGPPPRAQFSGPEGRDRKSVV